MGRECDSPGSTVHSAGPRSSLKVNKGRRFRAGSEFRPISPGGNRGCMGRCPGAPHYPGRHPSKGDTPRRGDIQEEISVMVRNRRVRWALALAAGSAVLTLTAPAEVQTRAARTTVTVVVRRPPRGQNSAMAAYTDCLTAAGHHAAHRSSVWTPERASVRPALGRPVTRRVRSPRRWWTTRRWWIRRDEARGRRRRDLAEGPGGVRVRAAHRRPRRRWPRRRPGCEPRVRELPVRPRRAGRYDPGLERPDGHRGTGGVQGAQPSADELTGVPRRRLAAPSPPRGQPTAPPGTHASSHCSHECRERVTCSWPWPPS